MGGDLGGDGVPVGSFGAVLPLLYLATKAEILLLGLRGLPVLLRGVK